MVMVGEHGKDFLADEKCRFPVGKHFRALEHGGADSPDSPQVLFTGI
jgi:hypothetical protein